MRKLLALAALAIAVRASAQAPASASDDVMKAVRQFVDGFNRGDSAGAVAACADQAAILDEFPPHEWHGAGACATWVGAYDADAAKNGITDGVVTLHQPTHVDITGDVAYVVVQADYVYKKHEKLVKEINSVLTLTLQKGASGWLLTGWAWAKH